MYLCKLICHEADVLFCVIVQAVGWHTQDNFLSVWASFLSWDTQGCSHRSLAVNVK